MSEECAVWYWRHYVVHYELCENEVAAARFAVNLEEWENGAVSGVQFADGRIVERNAWAAYEIEEQRLWAERKKRAAEYAANPPLVKPKREITDPFSSEIVEINVDEPMPAWLGKRNSST